MATKLQFLVVAVFVPAVFAINDSKKKIAIDPLTAREVAASFEEALNEEQPLLKEEEREESSRRKSLVGTHLRSLKGGNANLNKPPEVPAPNSGDWASAFEKDVAGLVLGLSKGGLAATPMASQVAQIADLIENNMMPKVTSAHTVEQQELTDDAAAVSTIMTERLAEFTVVTTKEGTYTTESTSHKSCRVSEAIEYSVNEDCKSRWKPAHDSMISACEAYEQGKETYGTQETNKDVMEKMPDEDYMVYLERVTTTFCGDPLTKEQHCTECNKEDGDGESTGDGDSTGESTGDSTGESTGEGNGYLDELLKLEAACTAARSNLATITAECKTANNAWHEKRNVCDSIQDQMDDAACQWSIAKEQVCLSTEGISELNAYNTKLELTRQNEIDRKAEWRGLQRMKCLIDAFMDGSVNNTEIEICKNRTYSTDHLNITYPTGIPGTVDCTMSNMFPSTDAYKAAEFTPLPATAPGKLDVNECTQLVEVSTAQNPEAPQVDGCECAIVPTTSYSAGALVRCTNCLDVHNSVQTNSCPSGTKLFSPQSREDWDVFMGDAPGATRLADPNWIIDVTRPQNGCAGRAGQDNEACEHPWNSDDEGRRDIPQFIRWKTADGSPWWLRSTTYTQPGGDYSANCYMDLFVNEVAHDSNIGTAGYPDCVHDSDAYPTGCPHWENPISVSQVTFAHSDCNYHSKSYYCQSISVNLDPKGDAGSETNPVGCICKKVEVTGVYHPNNLLIKCENCKDIYRSQQTNSCPYGTKLFSPESRDDWKTFLASATDGPVRAPHWIIDVTRPQDGCGDCKEYAMKTGIAEVATWKTSDLSPWFLRNEVHSPAHDDYKANCFMNMFAFANEDAIIFDVGAPTAEDPVEAGGECWIHSKSYFCQSVKTTTTTTTTQEPALCSSLPYTDGMCPSGRRQDDTAARCSSSTCVDSDADDVFCCQAIAKCSVYQASSCTSGELVDNADTTLCADTTCAESDANQALCCKATCYSLAAALSATIDPYSICPSGTSFSESLSCAGSTCSQDVDTANCCE